MTPRSWTRRVIAARRHRIVQRILPWARRMATLGALAVATVMALVTWSYYVIAPWTRDGSVRVQVASVAPEVSGRITELHVADNKYVRKGDLLMVIDPTNYEIAASQARAAVQQAQANVQSIDAQMSVQRHRSAPTRPSWSKRRPCSCSPSSRRTATRIWHNGAWALFRMRSSSRRNCISSRPRCRPHSRPSTWRSGKSSR